jgi:hypothetical protein
VEGREHRELELHIISGGGDEGDILVPCPFRQLNRVGLGRISILFSL